MSQDLTTNAKPKREKKKGGLIEMFGLSKDKPKSPEKEAEQKKAESKKQYESAWKKAEESVHSAQKSLDGLTPIKKLDPPRQFPKGPASAKIEAARRALAAAKQLADGDTTAGYQAALRALTETDCPAKVTAADEAVQQCKRYREALDKAFERETKLLETQFADASAVTYVMAAAHDRAMAGEYQAGAEQLESAKTLKQRATEEANEIKDARDKYNKAKEQADKSLTSLKKQLASNDYEAVEKQVQNVHREVTDTATPTVALYQTKSEQLGQILDGAKSGHADRELSSAKKTYEESLAAAQRCQQQVHALPNVTKEVTKQIDGILTDNTLAVTPQPPTAEAYQKAAEKLAKTGELLAKSTGDLDKQKQEFDKRRAKVAESVDEAENTLATITPIANLAAQRQTPLDEVRNKIAAAKQTLKTADDLAAEQKYVQATETLEAADSFKVATTTAAACQSYFEQLQIAAQFLHSLKGKEDAEWGSVAQAIEAAHSQATNGKYKEGVDELKACKKLSEEATKAADKVAAARERFEIALAAAQDQLSQWESESTVGYDHLVDIQDHIDQIVAASKASKHLYDELAKSLPTLFVDAQAKHNYDQALQKVEGRLSVFEDSLPSADSTDWKQISDKLVVAGELAEKGSYEDAIKELKKADVLCDKLEQEFEPGGAQEKADLKAQPNFAKRRREVVEARDELLQLGAPQQAAQLTEFLADADVLAERQRFERALQTLEGPSRGTVEKLIKEGKAFNKKVLKTNPLFLQVEAAITELSTVASTEVVQTARAALADALEREQDLQPLVDQLAQLLQVHRAAQKESDDLYHAIVTSLQQRFEVDDLTLAYQELRPLEAQRGRNEYDGSRTGLAALRDRIKTFTAFTDDQLNQATKERDALGLTLNRLLGLPGARDDANRLLESLKSVASLAQMGSYRDASAGQAILKQEVDALGDAFRGQDIVLTSLDALQSKRAELFRALDEKANLVAERMEQLLGPQTNRQSWSWYYGEYPAEIKDLYERSATALQAFVSADQTARDRDNALDAMNELLRRITGIDVDVMAQDGLAQQQKDVTRLLMSEVDQQINILRDQGDRVAVDTFRSQFQNLVASKDDPSQLVGPWNALKTDVLKAVKENAERQADAAKKVKELTKQVEKLLESLQKKAGSKFEKYVDGRQEEFADLCAYASSANRACYEDALAQLGAMKNDLEQIIARESDKTQGNDTFKQVKKDLEAQVNRIEKIKNDKTSQKYFTELGITLVAEVGQLPPDQAKKKVDAFAHSLDAAIQLDQRLGKQEEELVKKCEELRKEVKTLAQDAPEYARVLKAQLKELTTTSRDWTLQSETQLQQVSPSKVAAAAVTLKNIEEEIDKARDPDVRSKKEAEAKDEQEQYERQVRVFYSDYKTFKKDLLPAAKKAIQEATKPDKSQYKHLKSYVKQVEKMLPPLPDDRSLKEKATGVFDKKPKPGKLSDLAAPKELLSQARDTAERIIMMPEGAAVLSSKQLQLALQRWQESVGKFVQGVETLRAKLDEYGLADDPPGTKAQADAASKKIAELKDRFDAAAFDATIAILIKEDKSEGAIEHKKAREQGLAIHRRYVETITDPLLQVVVGDSNPFSRLNVETSALHFALKSLQLVLLVNG